MLQRHALKPDAGDIDGLVAIQSAQVHAGARRVICTRRKGVFKDALQHQRSGFIRVEWKPAWMAKAEWAQVVEAENMVGVAVRVENGVHMPDLFAQRLVAEVGSGVDQNSLVALAV